MILQKMQLINHCFRDRMSVNQIDKIATGSETKIKDVGASQENTNSKNLEIYFLSIFMKVEKVNLWERETRLKL